MSDSLHKTGLGIGDENSSLPTLDDMYKPPEKDDFDGFQSGNGQYMASQPQPVQMNIPPQYSQPMGGFYSEYDIMREKGRKLAKGIAITFMVLSALGILSELRSFDESFVKAVSGILGDILNIYFAYCFMNGGNKTRIYYGVTSIIGILFIALIILAFNDMGGAMGDFMSAIFAIVMIPLAAFYGFVAWATLFNKNVKAYCGAL